MHNFVILSIFALFYVFHTTESLCSSVEDHFDSKAGCKKLCLVPTSCTKSGECWLCNKCNNQPNTFFTKQKCNYECKTGCKFDEETRCYFCDLNDCPVKSRTKKSCKEFDECEYGCELTPKGCWECKKKILTTHVLICTLAVVFAASAGVITILVFSIVREMKSTKSYDLEEEQPKVHLVEPQPKVQ